MSQDVQSFQWPRYFFYIHDTVEAITFSWALRQFFPISFYWKTMAYLIQITHCILSWAGNRQKQLFRRAKSHSNQHCSISYFKSDLYYLSIFIAQIGSINRLICIYLILNLYSLCILEAFSAIPRPVIKCEYMKPQFFGSIRDYLKVISRIKIGGYFSIFHLERLRSCYRLWPHTELCAESSPFQLLLVSMALRHYICLDLVIQLPRILFIKIKLVRRSIIFIFIFWPLPAQLTRLIDEPPHSKPLFSCYTLQPCDHKKLDKGFLFLGMQTRAYFVTFKQGLFRTMTRFLRHGMLSYQLFV